MESKPSETGKQPSAPPSEAQTGAGSTGGGTVGTLTTTQTPATTAVSSFPRLPPLPASSPSGTAPSGTQPRGGVAIGVPAHHTPRPHQPFTTFGPTPPSSAQLQHQHQFLSPIHRAPDSSPSNASQVRSTGIPNIGMFSSINAGKLRPSGPAASLPQRPGQTPIRSTPPTSSNPAFNQQQRMVTQGMPRPPSSMPPPSGPLPPSSVGQQMQMHGPSSMRPSSATTFRPPQQRPPQTLQQTPPLYHGPAQHLQQTPQNTPFPPPPLASPFLQQTSRVPAGGGMLPPLGGEMSLNNVDTSDSGDKIISKKTIQELFSQIDPSEKLEPDVEDALIEIAEDFVESLTTFACSLAKHRKSTILETKDVLLHAEKNWNITPPGFCGDEIKLYRKQNVTDIHRERLTLIKKSMGDQRSHAAKTAAPTLTSPVPQQQRP